MKKLKRTANRNELASKTTVKFDNDPPRVALLHESTKLIRVLRQQQQQQQPTRRQAASLLPPAIMKPSTTANHLSSLLSTTSLLLATALKSSTTTNSTAITTRTANGPAPPLPAVVVHHTSHYFNDQYYSFDADATKSIHSYKLYEFYEKYKPEVGARTALILGSMLMLIVLYILWKNRCRCFCSGEEDAKKADEELAYWLNHVENNRNKKEREEERECDWPQQLPTASVDAKQATAAWVIEHRKRWSCARKPSKTLTQHQQQQKSSNGNQATTAQNRQITHRSFKMDVKQSAKNVPLLNQLMRPFRSSKNVKNLTSNSNTKNNKNSNNEQLSSTAADNKPRLHLHPLKCNNYNSSNRLFEELDTNTQLLINYARIGAIDSTTHFNPVHLNKLTGGLAFSTTHHLASPGDQTQSAITPGLTSHRVTSELRPGGNLTSGTPVLLSNALGDGDGQQTTDLAAIGDIMLGRNGIVQGLVTNMAHRRRTSWPRGTTDHLQFFTYTRGIRSLYSRAAALASTTTTAGCNRPDIARHNHQQQQQLLDAPDGGGSSNNNYYINSSSRPSGNLSSRNFN